MTVDLLVLTNNIVEQQKALKKISADLPDLEKRAIRDLVKYTIKRSKFDDEYDLINYDKRIIDWYAARQEQEGKRVQGRNIVFAMQAYHHALTEMIAMYNAVTPATDVQTITAAIAAQISESLHQ